jgi:hypothetical protein
MHPKTDSDSDSDAEPINMHHEIFLHLRLSLSA